MVKDIWYIRSLMDEGIKLDCAGNPETPERLILAQANAELWRSSVERKRLAQQIAQQIKEIHAANRESLWWIMTNNKI